MYCTGRVLKNDIEIVEETDADILTKPVLRSEETRWWRMKGQNHNGV